MVRLAKIQQVVAGVTLVLMLVAIYAIFMHAPLEKVMREVQKIFYVHVGLAWNAFFAFFVVFVASILYLATRRNQWDILAKASAELGVLFTTLVLITGPIWGRSAWNTWWTWEPRLTTTLILWFLYLGYLAIRASISEEQRRLRLAAVFGIISFIDVPLVYLSIRWWQRNHPIIFGEGGGGLHPAMLQALIVTVLAFTALFVYLALHAMSLESTRRQLDQMKDQLRQQND